MDADWSPRDDERWVDALVPPWERRRRHAPAPHADRSARGEGPAAVWDGTHPGDRPARGVQPVTQARPAGVFPRRAAHVRGGGGGGRRAKIMLAGALVLVFAACTTAGALLWYGRSTLQQDAIDGIAPKGDGRTVTLPDGEAVEILNVLVVGTDDPATLTPEQRAEVAPDERAGRRPDSIMLAQVEVGGSGAALLSIPRDLRVELCDGSTNKINAAYAAASGAGKSPESCLVTTVTSLSGIEIDHFVEVDFGGFVGVVEALGGVTMYFEEPMVDRKAHLDIPAGCVTLTSTQALGFVRSRGYDDDFGRIARQQRFIKDVVDEVARVGTLANPRRVVSLVDQGARAVRTDDQLSLGDMRDLALGLRNLTSSDLIAHTVPATPQTIDGVSYVIADEDQAEVVYQSFRDGTVLRSTEPGPQPQPEPEPTLAPADVAPIAVLNGSDTAGLAAAAAELLQGKGFEVAEVGDAEAKPVDATQVLHEPGLADEAGVLAGFFDGTETREQTGGPPLALVLGADTDLASIETLLAADIADGTEDAPEPPAAAGEPAGDQGERASDAGEPASDEGEPAPAAGEPAGERASDAGEPASDEGEPAPEASPAADDQQAGRSYRGTERTADRC